MSTSPLVMGPILPGDWPTSSTDPSYGGYRDALIKSASTLLESIETSLAANDSKDAAFQKVKVFNSPDCPTQTLTSTSPTPPGSGDTQSYKWHVRQSTHPDLSYEQFRFGLYENHSENETKYIDDAQKGDRLQTIKQGEMEIWKMLYHQAFPASNRSFTFLIFMTEFDASTAGNRRFIVVSIPVAHPEGPPEKGYVRGRYVSVEECRETPQGIVWTMAVSSDPGGMVPGFLSEKVMPSKVSEDVPSFLKWIKTQSVSSSTSTTNPTGDAPSLPPIENSGAL